MNELQGGQTGGGKLSFEEFSEVQEGNNESLNLGNVRGDIRVSRFPQSGQTGKAAALWNGDWTGHTPYICVSPPPNSRPYTTGKGKDVPGMVLGDFQISPNSLSSCLPCSIIGILQIRNPGLLELPDSNYKHLQHLLLDTLMICEPVSPVSLGGLLIPSLCWLYTASLIINSPHCQKGGTSWLPVAAGRPLGIV